MTKARFDEIADRPLKARPYVIKLAAAEGGLRLAAKRYENAVEVLVPAAVRESVDTWVDGAVFGIIKGLGPS